MKSHHAGGQPRRTLGRSTFVFPAAELIERTAVSFPASDIWDSPAMRTRIRRFPQIDNCPSKKICVNLCNLWIVLRREVTSVVLCESKGLSTPTLCEPFINMTVQILGIRFFNGDADEAIEAMSQRGGFVVAPSGTCFARLREDERYRCAILAADLAIADSGLMVSTWRVL